jgi:hypothetical protein
MFGISSASRWRVFPCLTLGNSKPIPLKQRQAMLLYLPGNGDEGLILPVFLAVT